MSNRRQKRILMLVENLPVPFDRRMWMEATTLVGAGYGVSIICPQGDYADRFEVREGVNIYRYPLPSLSGITGHLMEYGWAVPATFLLALAVWWRDGFDVIHSANPPDLFFIVGAFFKILGKKFVFDHHDLVPEMCNARWTGWKWAVLHRVCRWAEYATFRTADRVIATNESYRRVAVTRGRVPADRVVVVRSGPRLSRFQPVPAQLALKNGRTFMVAYLGVMGPNDGLEYLLQAIGHIVNEEQRTDIQFVLIGAGDLHRAIMNLSKQLRVDEYVRFTGRIPDDDVIALLSSSDVCVAPDPSDPVNDLSTMNKIIEYMALGKPIVAFDLREARVSAGDAAAYATPNDPVSFAREVLALLASPERRRAMGESARHRFETSLAWELQVDTLVALHRDLIGEPHSGLGSGRSPE
jgi:glycosyltransferase involved in cell wall biosynthesis